MNEITPTRAAVLELQGERRAMREGYEFLDEKRLALAAEMLRLVKGYEAERADFDAALGEAATALREVIARHGFNGVQVYPAVTLQSVGLEVKPRALLGVRLDEASLTVQPGDAPAAVNPSPEAERCRRAFLALFERAAPLALSAANLERLRHEYRRTERRARALEEVLIPETDETLRTLEARLEEIEQEEGIRVRLAHEHAHAGVVSHGVANCALAAPARATHSHNSTYSASPGAAPKQAGTRDREPSRTPPD